MTIRAALTTVGLVATVGTLAPAAAHAIPERYADAGSIVWCDGEEGSLTAIDTTAAGTTSWVSLRVGDALATAETDVPLFDGVGLHGTLLARDDETGAPLGDLTVAGSMVPGDTEVLSGWHTDEDGRRTRTEGTRTALSGQVSLSLGEVSTTLECVGWVIDTETFVITGTPAADAGVAWWTDTYELGDGDGTIGFYGEHQHELGVALDLFDPSYVLGGERLQIRSGQVEGSLLLRDPDTWAVVGVARVAGTIVETGREQTVRIGPDYRSVTDLVRYDVALTISTTDDKEWSGTWPATHETTRTLSVVPPRAL